MQDLSRQRSPRLANCWVNGCKLWRIWVLTPGLSSAIIKALISKSSQSSIMIPLNCVNWNHHSQRDSNLSALTHAYMNTYSCEHLFGPIIDLFGITIPGRVIHQDLHG